MKKMLKQEMERNFRPEFLNRLDDIIVFRSLTSRRPEGNYQHRTGEGR